MAQATWNDGSDNWTSAGDWSTDAVPGASDDVIISSQITTNVGTVNSVTISAGGFGALLWDLWGCAAC